jgi:hypothetical protein
MNPETNHPFTRAQWDVLNDDERRAVDAVVAHLRGGRLPRGDELTDVFISAALNLLRPVAEAVIPDDENDGDITRHIQRKFCAVYHAGLALAEGVLARHGKKSTQDYNFLLLAAADAEDLTHVVVVDWNAPRRYLHEWCAAAEFQFADLAAIAVKVLAVRNSLVAAVLRHHTIHVVVQGGAVQEVTDVPPGLDVQVVDYDVEHVEPERLQISPLDGEACVITQF